MASITAALELSEQQPRYDRCSGHDWIPLLRAALFSCGPELHWPPRRLQHLFGPRPLRSPTGFRAEPVVLDCVVDEEIFTFAGAHARDDLRVC